MRKLADRPRETILTAARMALSNKIWLNEMTQKTADDIVEDIWNSLEDRQETFAAGENQGGDGRRAHPTRGIAYCQDGQLKKAADFDKIRRLSLQGNGMFSVVEDETEIAGAILECLS